MPARVKAEGALDCISIMFGTEPVCDGCKACINQKRRRRNAETLVNTIQCGYCSHWCYCTILPRSVYLYVRVSLNFAKLKDVGRSLDV